MGTKRSKHLDKTRRSRIHRRLRPARQTERPSGRAGKLLVVILLVSACAAAAHWPALEARALSFDDNQYLLDNHLVKRPSWYSARRFLVEVLRPSTVHGYYQPLSMISLMLDYAAGGRADDPYVFHRTSLSLHVANTALIVILLYLLFGNVWIAGAVGLLFGVHPLTVEPIPWIGERKTLLAAFFSLLCLVAYVRYTHKLNWRLYGLALVLFVLALMSKPTATPIAACLLLLDYWPLRRLGKRAVIEKLPFLAIAGASALITFYSQKLTAHVRMPSQAGPMRIPLIICHNIVFYPFKMLWPANLSSHYPIPEPLDLTHPMVLAGVIGTFVLLGLLIVSWRWTRGAVVGWSFFFIAIFPTLGVIGFNNVVASDKFAYLPSVGLLIALAGFLNWLWTRWKRARPAKIARIGVVCAVVLLAAAETLATRRYLRCWRDTETLYRHMLAQAPESPWVHMDLANALTRKGRFEQAIDHYRKAIALRPDYPKFYYNLGITLSRMVRLDEAIVQCRRALALMPDYPKAHNGLGSMLAQKGLLDEAMNHYRRAIELAPEYVEPYYNLGNAYLRKRRYDQAITCYRKALALQPTYAYAHFAIGIALERTGQTAEAIKHYEQVLRVMPGHRQARTRLERLRAPRAAG